MKNNFFIFRDFSRFSEECQGYGVGGFERVTFRPSVRPVYKITRPVYKSESNPKENSALSPNNNRDFSRFSEEWLLFDVGRFERVTFRTYVRMCVTKSPMFGGLDGVRAPRHGPCNCAQNTPTGP